MERRDVLRGGATLGTALVAGDLLLPEATEAAGIRHQRGIVSLPGLGNADMNLNILGREVTGTVGGAVNALIEGTFVRNVLQANLFGVEALGVSIGTLDGRTGRRGAIGGNLTINGVSAPYTTTQLTVSSSSLRRFAGAYRGQVGVPVNGEVVEVEHETTFNRRGGAVIAFDFTKLGAAGGPRGLGGESVGVPLEVFTPRLGGECLVAARAAKKTTDDLELISQREIAEGLARVLILFARGGPALGMVPRDFSLEFSNIFMSFAIV